MSVEMLSSADLRIPTLTLPTASMDTLAELLESNVGSDAQAELNRRAVSLRLGTYLKNADPFWYRVLFPFVDEAPWRFWEEGAVRLALELLEQEPPRSREALNAWQAELASGLDALFLGSAPARDEEGLSLGVADMVRLGTIYHPEYLRYVEHVFGNLLVVYWAAIRKGAVRAKFDLRSGAEQMSRAGHEVLTRGYDERVRNAIAHGQIRYRGFDVQYGPAVANYVLEPRKLISKFDELVRTCNALVLAIILFLARNPSSGQVNLPARLLTLFGAGAIDQKLASISGSFESEPSALSGRQLHVALRAHFHSRMILMYQCAKLAYHLIQLGATSFKRFLFEIDYGKEIKGLVIIDADVLRELLDTDAPATELRKAFPETQLLWFDEGKVRRTIRLYGASVSAAMQLLRDNRAGALVASGFRTAHSGFRIRQIKNVSAGWRGRVDVTAVLRDPNDAANRDALHAITKEILGVALKRWIRTRMGGIGQGWGWPRRPKQVFIKLYRNDGPLRWLSSGGWVGGNIVLTAEYIHPISWRYKYVFVDRPEETWSGIRFRYGMDQVWYNDLPQRLRDVLEEDERK